MTNSAIAMAFAITTAPSIARTAILEGGVTKGLSGGQWTSNIPGKLTLGARNSNNAARAMVKNNAQAIELRAGPLQQL